MDDVPRTKKRFFTIAGFIIIILSCVCFLIVRFPQEQIPTNHDVASLETPKESESNSEIELPTPSPLSRNLTLFACGDILLSRTPGKRAGENGYKYLFTEVREAVSQADLAFANLESPASYLGAPYPGKPEDITFRADPNSLFGLKWAGFDVLSLANNHMNDYGPQALSETIEYLDLLEIRHCGAGRDLDDARTPAIIVSNGVKIAFLAYAEPIWSVIEADETEYQITLLRSERRMNAFSVPVSPNPNLDTPGTGSAGVAIASSKAIEEDIRRTKDIFKPDYIFVSIHWGEEHQNYPLNHQKILGRAIIDAGATAVLGHHPHVLQGMEFYNGGAILYSMGNFIFDMRADKTYETAYFLLNLRDGALDSIEIVPVKIEKGSYVPARIQGTLAGEILDNIKKWSGTTGERIEIFGNSAKISNKIKK